MDSRTSGSDADLDLVSRAISFAQRAHHGQLRKDRELQWALGKLVSCWLQGGEQLRGRLTAVAEDRLELEGDRGRVAVDRARVTKVRLEPDVKWPRRAAGT